MWERRGGGSLTGGRYMAPEVVRCEGDYGTPVDIYSAGERVKSRGGRDRRAGGRDSDKREQ